MTSDSLNNSISSLSANTTATTSNTSTNSNANANATTVTAAVPSIKQAFPQYYPIQQPHPFAQGPYQIQTQQIPFQHSLQTQFPQTSQQPQPTQYYTQDYNAIDPYYQTQQYNNNNQYYYNNGITASAIPSYQYSQNLVPLQYSGYTQLTSSSSPSSSSTQAQVQAQVAPLPLPPQQQAQVQQYYYDATTSATPITNFITECGPNIGNNLDSGMRDSNSNSNNNNNNNNSATTTTTTATATTNNNNSNVASLVIPATTAKNNSSNTTGTTTTNTTTNNNSYVQDEYAQLAPLPQLQAISQHLPIPFTSQPQFYFAQQQQQPQPQPQPQQLAPQIQTQPPFQLPTTLLPTIKPPIPSYRTVPHTNFGVITTMWEDENTLCYQVEANGVNVVRRADNNFINGTKLLNVTKMTRGRRDGILKAEKIRHVVKIGSMHLKGVWIPFERAQLMAQRENILDLLYPLFVPDIESLLSGN